MEAVKRELDRVTVNLIPRASKALQEVTDLTGDSKTDIINRAVQMYAFFERVRTGGGEVIIREDGDTHKIIWY